MSRQHNESVCTGKHAAAYVTWGLLQMYEWRKPRFAARPPPEPDCRGGSDAPRLAANLMKPLAVMPSRQPQHADGAFAAAEVEQPAEPINADRFDQALARVRQRRALEQFVDSGLARQILRLLARGPKLLVGERQHRLYPLDVEQIEYIEADGNYVTIRVGAAEYISRDSIKRLSAELADYGFVRIDRSTLLNIRAVQFAEPIGHGTLAFTLASGACLHSSRTYRDAIVRVLPWHHCRSGSDSEAMDRA